MKLMYHDDDCGELLDANGLCAKCGFYPDMQSTAFKEVPDAEVAEMCKGGRAFIGLRREPVRQA